MAPSETVKSIDPRLPVVVGVGQLVNRTDRGATPLEPVALMTEAAALAETDSGVSGLLKRVDLVAAIPTVTWRYRDPGAIVASAHGAPEARTWYANVGGNLPQLMVNRIASQISAGDLDMALLVGAESGRGRRELKRANGSLDWTVQDESATPDWTEESSFILGDEADMARRLIMPLQLYPVFENAIWHESGRTLDEHLAHIGRLWNGYSKIAAGNPYAWHQREYTPEEIVGVTADNRMVAFPYRKLMVANPKVDMASAVLICSAGAASDLGVTPDRWVFIHSGTDAKDRSVSARWDFTHSPAIASAGNAALRLANVGIDDVAHLDLYSCYPSAVQIAMAELGIGDERQLTVYGGLPFAGGPWNNPVGHAIASMVDVLRADAGTYGLVTANGGNIDKHAFGVYSTDPPQSGFRYENTQEQADLAPARASVVDHDGSAGIESWTVMYHHDSEPTQAHVAALTPHGERTWAISTAPDVFDRLSREDVTGVQVMIDGEGNFTID